MIKEEEIAYYREKITNKYVTEVMEKLKKEEEEFRNLLSKYKKKTPV